MGKEKYESEDVEDELDFNPINNEFGEWLEERIIFLEELFEDKRLNDIFFEATNKLDEESRMLFEKEIKNYPEFYIYFENEIKEVPFAPLYDYDPKEDYEDVEEDKLLDDFINQLKKDIEEKQVIDIVDNELKKDNKNNLKDDDLTKNNE